MDGISGRLPLFEALMHAAGRVGFHMPGHAGGRAFPKALLEHLFAFDNTEISVLGDLNNPSGAVLESERQTARIFGAARTHYVTSGSTTSLKAAVAAVVPSGGTVLLPRAVHKSIAHVIAELDICPVFLPQVSGTDHPLPLPAAPDDAWLQAVLGPKPAIDAIILTSPDYYGHLLGISVFADLAAKYDACLIVDAAHGAHLLADPRLKHLRALEAGADLVIESAHKTLAALTPGSFLHVSEQAVRRRSVNPDRLSAMLRLYQTSSPSFPIAASLEYAAAALAGEGAQQRQARVDDIQRFAAALPVPYRLVRPEPCDPLRLVIDVSGGALAAEQVERELALRGIDIEMRDARRLVLIVSLWQDPADFAALLRALQSISRMTSETPGVDDGTAERLTAVLAAAPVFARRPRDAIFGRVKRLAVRPQDAEGHIAAEVITPTPPCIPLVWPGERITALQARLCLDLLPEGTRVLVLADDAGNEDAPSFMLK